MERKKEICRCLPNNQGPPCFLLPLPFALWFLALRIVASVLVFACYFYLTTSRLVSCSTQLPGKKISFVGPLMSFAGDTTFLSGQLRVA